MVDTAFEDYSNWLDVLGPKVRLLTAASKDLQQYAVILGHMAPGVVVPLHRHEDRESFFVLAGSVEGYANGRWTSLNPGEFLDIVPNELHAWRNASDSPARLLIVTTEKMASFFREIGTTGSSVGKIPSADDMIKLLEAAERYGYAMATGEENAAIGLTM